MRIIGIFLNCTKKLRKDSGFSLPELLVSVFILVVAFSGIMLGFVRCINLSEMSMNSSKAMILVESKMEEIKNTTFGQLVATYDEVTFTDAGFDGVGVIYIDDTNADFYTITISFCWRQKNGRVVGEDTDLDGALDSGEDANGNGIIDSTVQIVSAVYDE